MAEYGNAANNPEIVTPQNILYDTFIEANAPMVSAIVSAIRALQETVKAIDPTIEIDGTILGKAVQKWRTNEIKRTGVQLV